MSELAPLTKEEIQQLAAEIIDSDPIMSPPVSSESEEELSDIESSNELSEDSLSKCCGECNCPRYINLQLRVDPECKLTEKEITDSITEYVKTLTIEK